MGKYLLKLKRAISFSLVAEKTRNDFQRQWGENARACLDWLEHETQRAPEHGECVDGQRFTLTIEVDAKDGIFYCRAVYIFNDTAVKWLLFSHQFLPKPPCLEDA